MAHVGQSRPDSSLGFQLKVLKTLRGVPSSLEGGLPQPGGFPKVDTPGVWYTSVNFGHAVQLRQILKLSQGYTAGRVSPIW